MNVIFKLLIFSVSVNFAAGIMLLALPEVVENDANTGGLVYIQNYTEEFTLEMNKTINPDNQIEDTSDLLDRIIDKLTLGIWEKLLNLLNKYMYGVITILGQVFGNSLEPELKTLLFGDENSFGVFKTGINIMYIFGGIYLWTSRKLNN